MDFKCSEIKESVKTIIKNIVKENVIQNKYFEFSNMFSYGEVNKIDFTNINFSYNL